MLQITLNSAELPTFVSPISGQSDIAGAWYIVRSASYEVQSGQLATIAHF